MKKVSLKNIILIVGLISLIFIGQGCFVKPEFPNSPKIEFDKIQKITLPGLLTTRDSIIIAIKFQDGDGDLGLAASDTLPPFQELNADGSPNEFYFNYYINMYRKVNGRFIKFEFQGLTLNGRFTSLNLEGRAGPLEGILRRSIVISSTYPHPNDTVKFDIFIIDRQLNKSNLIETDTLVINVK